MLGAESDVAVDSAGPAASTLLQCLQTNDAMTEEHPPSVDPVPPEGSRPTVDKAVIKEALTELLKEIPAFCALRAQPGPGTEDAGGAVAGTATPPQGKFGTGMVRA